MSPTIGKKTQNRVLHIDRIGPTFNPSFDIALGPWCFLGAEEIYPNFEELPYSRPIENPDHLITEAKQVRILANYLAHFYGQKLNKRHNRDYSSGYWRLLLLPWIIAVTQTAWLRYLEIKIFIKNHSGENFDVPISQEAADWQIGNTDQLVSNFIGDPSYDFWFTSFFVRMLAPKEWLLLTKPLDTVHTQPTLTEKNIQPIGRVHGIMGRFYERWLLKVFLENIPVKPRSTLPKDFQWHSENAEENFPENFIEGLHKILTKTIPRCFHENFTENETFAQSHTFQKGRVRIVGTSLYYDEPAKFVAAHAFEFGERLVGVQHGGMYGYSASDPDAAEVEYSYDQFITWGWEKQDNQTGNMVPLPSPWIKAVKNNETKSNDIIMVGTQLRLGFRRLNARPQPKELLHYRQMKVNFFQKLKPTLAKQVKYRPMPDDNKGTCLLEKEFLQKHIPDIQFIEQANIWPILLQSRLTIADHPGTTFNLLLAANVPTVAYWIPNDWPICKTAYPLFEELKHYGVLFDSETEAAKHINAIWDDVGSWWFEPAFVSARKRWVEIYAKPAGRFWWFSWMKSLWQLSSGKFDRTKGTL